MTVNAVVIGKNVAHVCGFTFHGVDPKKNPCARHSPSCESKVKHISMCFSSNRCEICGYCAEHCVGHRGIKGWRDVLAYQGSL